MIGFRRSDRQNNNGRMERRRNLATCVQRRTRNLYPAELRELKLHEAAQATSTGPRFHGMAAHRASRRSGRCFLLVGCSDGDRRSRIRYFIQLRNQMSRWQAPGLVVRK